MNYDDIDSNVSSAVLQNLGGDWDESSEEEIDRLIRRIESMSGEELFRRFLVWHGIIGFDEMIIRAYKTTIGKDKSNESV